MPTQRSLFVFLLGCLLLGCNRAPPAPPPAVAKKAVEEAVNKGLDELGKQLDATNKDLEQKAVSFLIDGVRDHEHQRELFSKVQRLEDAGAKSNEVLSRGAYHQKDIYFRISPISDMEAAAAQIDFGLVLAVDPADRVMVVDASAKPAPRPEKGWPGAKAVDQYVLRKAKTWAAGWAYAPVVKKFGPEKVVVVAIRADQSAAPIVKKLRTLVPDLSITDGPDFGVRNTPFTIASVAPVEKLADVVKALDGQPILTVDEARRVVIVADLAELKPPRAEAKEAAPAK